MIVVEVRGELQHPYARPHKTVRCTTLRGARRVAVREVKQLVRDDWSRGIPSIDIQEATQAIKEARKIELGGTVRPTGLQRFVAVEEVR